MMLTRKVLTPPSLSLSLRRRVYMEMPNLFPVHPLHVDALISPSYYVKRHASVRAMLEEAAARGRKQVCHVINPGVDVQRFSKPLPSGDARGGGALGGGRTWAVGFMGRLAEEKSPGLFISKSLS